MLKSTDFCLWNIHSQIAITSENKKIPEIQKLTATLYFSTTLLLKKDQVFSILKMKMYLNDESSTTYASSNLWSFKTKIL